MAVALRQEATVPVAELLKPLQSSTRSDAALRLAVDRADEIAPAVIEQIDRAATGADLLAHEENLLFWGIHVLGAARRTELYQPLMRFISECPADDLEQLLGDVAAQTLGRIVISVFDGDPAPLLEACANCNIDGFLRWNLIGALARLTFDSAVPRDTTLAFLDRFEREPLAEPEDDAWQGWQDAICLLGLEDMRERLRAACKEGRFVQPEGELEYCEEQFTIARNLAPGDPGLFDQANYLPLGDPVEALQWLSDRSDAFSEDEEEDEDDPFEDEWIEFDPASSTALNQDEIDWLGAVLAKVRLAGGTISAEHIDGLFCALAMDSDRSRARESVYAILATTRDRSVFENDEEATRAARLFGRMWNATVARLDADCAHRPILQASDAPKGQRWARGFITGMHATESDWLKASQNEDVRMFLGPILGLALDDGETEDKLLATPESRAEWAALLQATTVGLYAALRFHQRNRYQPQQPVRSTKVGRNEPCPCGSGKKYKRCCGAAEVPVLN